MKRKHKTIVMGGVWLLLASVLILASFFTDLSSLAFTQSTPMLTPAVYLPYISGSGLSITPPPPGDWLAYVNYYRALAELPPVTENVDWSYGDWLHARYMVKNDVVGHTEEPGNPWYTPEGDEASKFCNVMVSSNVDSTDEDAIDLWVQGAFHRVVIIDPALLQVGYGSYREADGGWQMGAVLDILRGLGSIPTSVVFPIAWPSDGMTVFLRSHDGCEFPDPLISCPGYSAPSGLPIILQVGPGNLTPSVTLHSFMQGSTSLEHCVFDETSYTNPDGSLQSLGRGILDSRDAIVLIPREPLAPGGRYTVSITADEQTYTWSFTVSSTAQAAGALFSGAQIR